MRIRAEHHTTYTYSQPVFLEPHHLYLYPAYRPYIFLHSYDIDVSPAPVGKSLRMDAENNNYYQVWFSDLVKEITIKTTFDVELTPFNPFDLIIEDVGDEPREILNLYLNPKESISDAAILWVSKLRRESSENPLSFISNLAQSMHDRWHHTFRMEEGVFSANETFELQEASCRDLAWLMIQLLRHSGFPSRFVSGYSFNPELDGHELHAWVEVWMNGAGWIGADPSLGLLATESYIPLAVSFRPELTLPVIGKFRGKATSVLHSSVNLHIL